MLRFKLNTFITLTQHRQSGAAAKVRRFVVIHADPRLCKKACAGSGDCVCALAFTK